MQQIYVGPYVTVEISKAVCRFVGRYLRLHKVERAQDLSEGARVRLCQGINVFKQDNLVFDRHGYWALRPELRHQGMWKRLRRWWRSKWYQDFKCQI